MNQSTEFGTAVITGASSGIGAALALEFARQHFNIVLAARRLDRLTEMVKQVEAIGRAALPVAADVTKDGDMEKVIAAAVEKFGTVDVVIANAGFGVVGQVENLKIDDFKRQFETNVYGVLRTVYASLPELKKSKGRFAIVGSVNGYIALPGSAPYAMSKFAVRALSEALYYEMKEYGVAVTHIAPGFVESEIRQVDNKGRWHDQAKSEAPNWLRIPAEEAAHQIARAILDRKQEAVITNHGKLAVTIQRHAPALVRSLIRVSGMSKRTEPGSPPVTK
jgi:short-subunit dehydrogenase